MNIQNLLQKENAELKRKLDRANNKLEEEVSRSRSRQRELEKTQFSLLEILQDSPVAVGITDKLGRFQFWNPLFFKMGRQVVTREGANEFRLDFKDPGTFDWLRDRLEREGRIYNQEVELLGENSITTWGQISMQNMEFEGEMCTLTWIYDITELKDQEASLTQAKQEAENANRAKSDFLAQMSHEIRTPINGIMAMADMLSLTPLNKEQIGMSKVVFESSNTLLTIINDILDFSKIEAGRIDIDETGFSISGITEGVVELLSSTAFEKGLEINLCVDPNIHDHLVGDPVRLRQVLMNLLSNAIKFTEAGQVTMNVSLVETVGGTSHVRFAVVDTGVGLSEEQISNLFQPFHQADSSITRRFGGTGLGLAISRRLVNLMGGDFKVKSTFGNGAKFWFELPLAQKSEKRSLMRYDLSGIQAIIVAATSESAMPVERYLEFLGAECVVTASYDETVAWVEAFRSNNRKVDAIINLDAGCNRFWSAVLENNAADWTGDGIALVCNGLHPGGGKCEGEEDGVRIVTIPRPRKREIFCQNIAAAVGRFSEKEIEREARRLEDMPTNVFFDPPSREEALAEGTLILAAEDNLINQMVIETVLNKLGFVVDLASDGKEALEKFNETHYGLLLTDCHMPEIDGYQLTAEIRKIEQGTGKRIPVIALTADAVTGTEQQCLKAGMDDYVTKPAARNILNRVICEWLPRAAELRRPAS